MCHSLLLLLFAYVSLVSSGPLARRFHPIPEYSLGAPYPVPFQNRKTWHLSGATVSTPNLLRLTPDKQSHKGGLWTSSAVKNIGQEWEITLRFNVWGRGDTYFGDGFALWYSEEPSLTGKVFGARDYWKGLGILFDTYDNGNRATQNHPFITVMYNDGTHSFVHGDGGLQQGVPACHAGFRSVFKSTPSRMDPPVSQASAVKVRYRHGRVTVDLNLHSSDTWTRCVDVENVVLPDFGYYFGVTASTGDLSDNHDIHSFAVSSTTAPLLPTVETKEEYVAEQYEQQKERDETMLDVRTNVDATKTSGGSDDSIDDVTEILQQSDVYKMLLKQGHVHDDKMAAIQSHLQEQLRGLRAHLDSMLSKIQASENEVIQHITHVESMSGIEIDDALMLHRDGTHWIWSFLVLSLIICCAFGTVWKKYQNVKKRHIL